MAARPSARAKSPEKANKGAGKSAESSAKTTQKRTPSRKSSPTQPSHALQQVDRAYVESMADELRELIRREPSLTFLGRGVSQVGDQKDDAKELISLYRLATLTLRDDLEKKTQELKETAEDFQRFKNRQTLLMEELMITPQGLEQMRSDLTSLKDNVETYRGELDKKEQELKNYERILAEFQRDFENLKKRTDKEKELMLQNAGEHVIVKLLPVLDSFEHALKNTQEAGNAEALLEGLRMIHRQMGEIFLKEGLEPIHAKGEILDPFRHEALMQEETKDYPEDMIMDELRKGYTFKTRVIRPSLVKVARMPKEATT
ncbi:MAG: nucleotide exchange factor GrpE [Armatimonadetes bacterium]|nr:nucleotide exchange factor GrpE [Armatimonadota bacterium]